MARKRTHAMVPFLCLADCVSWIANGGNCFQGYRSKFDGPINVWKYFDNRWVNNMSLIQIRSMYRRGTLMAAVRKDNTQPYTKKDLGLEA